VAQLSTPYNPVIAEGVREYCQSTFDGIDEEEMQEIMDWIEANTSEEEPQPGAGAGAEGGVAPEQLDNDKMMSFLSDKNYVPNASFKKGGQPAGGAPKPQPNVPGGTPKPKPGLPAKPGVAAKPGLPAKPGVSNVNAKPAGAVK
jgi:hypothetical protein